MSRLIIVSNRLPFSLDVVDDDAKLRQSSGGLVSALKGYFDNNACNGIQFSEKMWIGSADFSAADWEKSTQKTHAVDFTVLPLFIDEKIYTPYYSGFSNSTIWPLFHYFPSITQYSKAQFDAYCEVNQVFANVIAQIMQPGDVVWVQDYQLMLLPGLLRKVQPQSSIGFFLHIPFPSYEIFRLLPGKWKKRMLEGMLGADLIGFHTYDYAQHFMQSIKMILGLDNNFNVIPYNNRLVKADLFPIGIDYEKFSRANENHEVKTYLQELKDHFQDKKIIFSVDRLDYTKGLNFRLEGFDRFLEIYPEWHGKVVFVLNIVPSRDVIPAYIDRKKSIEEKVSTINGRFSSLSWQPLIYRYNHLPFHELCALYQAADVGLITPLRDGMNLVAKEFVAGCKDGGVLVLSELAGAASELNEAILVNPTDIEEMAEALATALAMPLQEQVQRMKLMQIRLADYDVVHWVNDFLGQLEVIKLDQKKLESKYIDRQIIKDICTAFGLANTSCLLLDYDGTLAAFAKNPGDASPSSATLNLLAQLCADDRVEVVIISGRDAQTLQKWLGHLPLNFVAEHGVFIKYKNADWEMQTIADPIWKDQIRQMLKQYVTRCAGSAMEEKTNTIAWHYRNTHPGLGFTRSRELLNNLQQLIANTPLQVIDGNKVIEVRLAGLDKGTTALKLYHRFNPDFTLCIGDDTTDEDMFKALKNKAYTIKVGSGLTAASYNLYAQRDVVPLLQSITTRQ